MPETRLQRFCFTLLMALVMVYALICYNIALEQGGLSNHVFALAGHELLIMWPLAVILEMTVVEKLSHKLTSRLHALGVDRPILILLTMSTMIVCLMCPTMSLAATLLFKHPGSELIAIWIQTTILNFPMALCWQIFAAGPLVRLIFRTLTQKQSLRNPNPTPAPQK